MDTQAVSVDQDVAVNLASPTFAVRFSDPSGWGRVGSQAQPHWKLAGAGQVRIDRNVLILSGRRPRPFWTAARSEIQIPVGDVMNVIREGSLIQCHVSIAGGSPKVLRFWAADPQEAERLERLLPQVRTEEFSRRVAEQNSFKAALDALGTRSVVMPSLVIVNCLVFLLTVYAGAGFFQSNGSVLVDWGSNFGPRTLDGEWWRLFTSIFLHFGVLHLALNMWALGSIGQLTEKLYGSGHFLVLYVVAGLSGSIASLYWHPGINSAGASGAIFGVIGGLVAFVVNPGTRIPSSVATSHIKGAAIFIGYNLLNGFAHAGIDNAAHIGGLAGGFVIGWVLARPVEAESRQQPLAHIGASALLGAVLLLACSWPLMRPGPTVVAERSFRQQLVLFAQDEHKALLAERALDKLRFAKTITDQEWANRVSAQIIPQWQSAEDRITATTLPADSRLVPLRTALVDWLDQKRLALDLLSDAARSHDPDKAEWGSRVSSRNAEKERELTKLIRRVY